MEKQKLTEKGRSYMECMYDKEIIETKDNWFVGLGQELMIASLNYAGECDEAHPDHDFIAGVMWERKRQKKLKQEDGNSSRP